MLTLFPFYGDISMERELWPIISKQINRLDRRFDNTTYRHPVGRIVRIYLWAVLHDRPVYWACKRSNWAGVRPPECLPNQSTMSRRLRTEAVWQMLTKLIETLDISESTHLIRYVDGKPLPVSKHSQDDQAKFGRGAGGQDNGYKLHAIYSGDSRPLAWSVTPLNHSEHQEAARLLDDSITPGYLVGDANYDANHLYEAAGQRDIQLIAARRYAKAKGLGHHRHSIYRRDAIARLHAPSPFVQEILAQRRQIETRFANLTNFGGGLTCLPPWVRGLRRVRLWVAGKIIVRLARDRCRAPNVA